MPKRKLTRVGAAALTALVTATTLLIMAPGAHVAGAAPDARNPTEVTCSSLSFEIAAGPLRSEAATGLPVSVQGCNHSSISGGSGTYTEVATGVTTQFRNRIKWASGKTSKGLVNYQLLTGPTDLCPAPPEGFASSQENVDTGTISGGTATALIGSTISRSVCVYRGPGNSQIDTLLPGTTAQF